MSYVKEGDRVIANKGKDFEYTGKVHVNRYSDMTILIEKDSGGFALEWKYNVEKLEADK